MELKSGVALVSFGLIIGVLMAYGLFGGFSEAVGPTSENETVNVEISQNCFGTSCNPSVYLINSGTSNRVLVEIDGGRSTSLYHGGDLAQFSEVPENTTISVYAFKNGQNKVLIAEQTVGGNSTTGR